MRIIQIVAATATAAVGLCVIQGHKPCDPAEAILRKSAIEYIHQAVRLDHWFNGGVLPEGGISEMYSVAAPFVKEFANRLSHVANSELMFQGLSGEQQHVFIDDQGYCLVYTRFRFTSNAKSNFSACELIRDTKLEEGSLVMHKPQTATQQQSATSPLNSSSLRGDGSRPRTTQAASSIKRRRTTTQPKSTAPGTKGEFVRMVKQSRRPGRPVMYRVAVFTIPGYEDGNVFHVN